jgi:hypothetical protein
VYNLVASLLKQMVQDSSVTSDNVKSFYGYHQDHDTRPTLEDLMEALELEIRTYSKVFIIVDALDECPEGDGTRANLLKALQCLAGTVKLLVTSRNLPSIAHYFKETKRLEIYGKDQDIIQYIVDRITSIRRRHLMELQDIIVNEILKNARGMYVSLTSFIRGKDSNSSKRFLLARLHMDTVIEKHNISNVCKALKNLPKEVDDTYGEAMARIERQNKDDRELARWTLSWVSYVRRPLTVEELQHALSIVPGMTHIETDNITDIEILTSVCAGLIVISEEQRIIRLVRKCVTSGCTLLCVYIYRLYYAGVF